MTPDQVIEQAKSRKDSRSSVEPVTPDSIVSGAKSRLQNSASGSFYTMRDTQPDRASKVISLSDRLGAERDFVDRNLETMEETAAQQERDGLLAQFPKASAYFSDAYRAAEAKDSVPNFAEIERMLTERDKKRRPKGWLQAPFSQAGDLGRSAAGDFVGMFGQGVRGLGDVTGAYVNTMRSGADMVPGLREGLAELDRVEAEIAPDAKILAPQNYLRKAGGGVADLGEIIRPEDMGFEDKVAGALGQIFGAVLTTMATGPAGSTGLFMGMGADQQGQAMRDAGLNPDEMLPELIGGAGVTGLSEQLRLGSVMRAIPREARQRVASKVISRILGQAGEEAIQEGTEGVLQNLITTTYDADASLFEGVTEQMTTAGTAAAVFQALVEAALPGRARGQRAQSNAQELADIREVIEQTPVFQRSRESIETFLNQAGEGDTILLHGEDLVELYQSDPEVFMQRMDEVGLSEDDITRAMDGHDIEVEAAKVLSVSEGFEDWVKIAKADEDTPTLRELERSVEDSDAMGAVDFTEAFERFAEQDEALEGFERVQSAVTEQLLGAGRGQAEAEGAGVVWGAMFRQLAEAGVDEAAVFERLGLQVNPETVRVPKPQEPQSLHSYVRELGGIRESFGEDGAGFMRGEVDARLGERVPGLINNASGVTLDEIYRAVTEEGGYEVRDEQDLLDLIEQDLSGERVYPIGQGEVYTAELDAYEAQFEKPDGEVMNQATEAGYEGQDTGEAREWVSAVEKGLDMSQEARMARAKEMGFDTEAVLYHGTDQNFEAFAPEGRARHRNAVPNATYLSNVPNVAEAFTYGKEGARTMPLYVRGEMKGVSLDDPALESVTDFAAQAESEGFAGIQLHYGEGSGGAVETIIFDPSNIRSVNAAFDPDHSDGANLLAQAAPKSMRSALTMSVEDRAAWYDESVTVKDRTTEVEREFDLIDVELKFKSTDLTKAGTDRKYNDVRIAIEGDVNEAVANMFWHGEQSAKYRADSQSVADATRIFSGSILTLQEFLARSPVDAVRFQPATEAHGRLYAALLKRMSGNGYRVFRIDSTSNFLIGRDDGSIAATGPREGTEFVLLRDGVDPDSLKEGASFEKQATQTPFGPEIAKTLTEVSDGGAGQSADSGRGSDTGGPGAGSTGTGSVRTVTEIEPAQRELFQRQNNKPRASVLIPGDGALSDQDVLVELTNAADRTSFMHESAHIFLELYAALESENEVIAERMAAVRKWLKIKPGEKITREQHEKFAESFEAYLMEGVAPSAELRGVFHSFRQWFVDVYRRLRGQLRNLEPEARDIFDRMLASDIEIEMAQGQYVGTLSKVMEGLMSPEQVEKYQKHARKAGNVARDKLFKKHMAEVRRREKKAYKEEQGRVEDMVRAQLSEWPEYRALVAFTEGGRTLDAAESPENTKLNTSENGEHPEIIAPEMGFTSADEMFKAVAKLPNPETIVRESVKKIMGDKYGDMLQDGTIEAEAMEAVFNEPNIRMMEAERNALAEKASGQPIPLIAIRKEADRLINTMPIDQVIKPGRYAIKARDLHKKALRAAARGKWDDALLYTHQAMLQHELARRAFKARDEIEKANRYLVKFAAHRKLDPKKIAPAYIAKIREFMALPGAQDQAEARDGLIKFADTESDEGRSVVLPSELLAGRDLPIRRRMTMEQFREFRDTVKNLNKIGRQNSAEAQEQFNEEAQALADEIDENFKGNRIRETRNPTRGERAARIGRQIDATIIRWPFLVEALQGGKIGKIVEAFDTRIRQALTNRNARRQEMADKLAAIFKKYGITQSELNKRASAPAIEMGSVKFEQIMAVAMNMGTEQNRERLAADPSMIGNMAAIEAMLAEHLEQRHWDATQEIWDLINTLWPEASAVERNATGVTPKKVEASSVQTKFGTYRGGYYPLKYDRAFLSNNDLQKKDEIEEWKNGVNGMATRASARQGFLKERQQNVERPLDLSLSVILSHIDDVTNDIYMREPASYVSRMLNKQRIRKAIKETQGEEYLKTLETILKRTVTGTEQPDTAFEKFMQTLRINASVAILGGNVVTAGLAPISYFQTVIPQYGFKTVFAGITEYYSNPIKNAKLIVEKSAFMRERQDTLTREAHELIRKSAGQSQFAKVQGAGYWMMAIAEKHSVSGPLWVGVYNDAKARRENEADAITLADRAVSTTQGSGLEIDQSVMQGGNEGLRLLSFMWGYVSGYYGTVRNDVVSHKGLKKLMPLVKHMVILNLVASMLEALIRGGFGDEDDPYVVAVWQMMMRNTFGLIPGVSSAFSKYDSGPAAMQVGTSVTRATENWAKAGTQMYEDGEAEGETVRRAMLDTLKAGGFLFGVPGTVQAMKIEKTYAEDDDPTLYEAIVSGPDDDN